MGFAQSRMGDRVRPGFPRVYVPPAARKATTTDRVSIDGPVDVIAGGQEGIAENDVVNEKADAPGGDGANVPPAARKATTTDEANEEAGDLGGNGEHHFVTDDGHSSQPSQPSLLCCLTCGLCGTTSTRFWSSPGLSSHCH